MTAQQIKQHTAETLASIALTERMLDLALHPSSIAQLSEREIESLWNSLRALNRFEKPLRLASERIEAKAFEADIEWLVTDHTTNR
jgi:hypothetical protein